MSSGLISALKILCLFIVLTTNSTEAWQDDELEEMELMRKSRWDMEQNSAAAGKGSEIFMLEDKDYPKSPSEDYTRRVGQVSGITTLPSDDVVIFHRGERQWTRQTQMPNLLNGPNESKNKIRSDELESQLVKNDTLMILDRENGSELLSFGSNLFYMPHSVASDSQGNLWVSDTGRHQVMRLPLGDAAIFKHSLPGNLSRIWPDIILGQAFTPGNDLNHFCQPAELAVSQNGRLLFVADGYCNRRVMVFTGQGQFLTSFGEQQEMSLVHSLALIEEKNLICVADRENARILCFSAGLDGDLSTLGEFRLELKYPIGSVYAMTSISADHLLVSSRQPNSNRYDLAILNPFTRELKLVWTAGDLLEPHSLASTKGRQYAYAADISSDAYKKVFKFNIITKN